MEKERNVKRGQKEKEGMGEETGGVKGGWRTEGRGKEREGGEGGRYDGPPRGGAASPTRCDHRFYHSWAWAEPFNMLPSAITHLSAGGAMSGRSAGCP